MKLWEKVALVVFALVLIVFVWPTAYVSYRKRDSNTGITYDYRQHRFTGALERYSNGRWERAPY